MLLDIYVHIYDSDIYISYKILLNLSVSDCVRYTTSCFLYVAQTYLANFLIIDMLL